MTTRSGSELKDAIERWRHFYHENIAMTGTAQEMDDHYNTFVVPAEVEMERLIIASSADAEKE